MTEKASHWLVAVAKSECIKWVIFDDYIATDLHIDLPQARASLKPNVAFFQFFLTLAMKYFEAMASLK